MGIESVEQVLREFLEIDFDFSMEAIFDRFSEAHGFEYVPSGRARPDEPYPIIDYCFFDDVLKMNYSAYEKYNEIFKFQRPGLNVVLTHYLDDSSIQKKYVQPLVQHPFISQFCNLVGKSDIGNLGLVTVFQIPTSKMYDVMTAIFEHNDYAESRKINNS